MILYPFDLTCRNDLFRMFVIRHILFLLKDASETEQVTCDLTLDFNFGGVEIRKENINNKNKTWIFPHWF